jgi:hypothetical protein
MTLSALVFPVVFLLGITRDISSSIASIAFALAALGVLGALFGQKVAKLLHIIDKIRQINAVNNPQFANTGGNSMEEYLKLTTDDDRFDFCRKQVLEWQGRMLTVGADRTSMSSRSSNSNASSSVASTDDGKVDKAATLKVVSAPTGRIDSSNNSKVAIELSKTATAGGSTKSSMDVEDYKAPDVVP